MSGIILQTYICVQLGIFLTFVIITQFQAHNTSSSSEIPYAIEYAPNGGAGATSHITVAVIGSN